MARVPPSLRVAAILMMIFGAIIAMNFTIIGSMMVAQPAALSGFPGGILIVHGDAGTTIELEGDGWGGNCTLDANGGCRLRLAQAAGTVVVPSTNLTAGFYLPQGVAGQVDAEDLQGKLAADGRDKAFALGLILAGGLAVAGGVTAWRLAGSRLPLAGAVALGLAGLVSGFLLLAGGAFAVWGVLRNRPLLDGVDLPGAVGHEEE